MGTRGSKLLFSLQSGTLVSDFSPPSLYPLVGVYWHRVQGPHPFSSLCRPTSLFFLTFVQGIQFLIENGLLKNTCEDIAQFLYKGEGLNKTAIGDYLGER